MKDVALPVAVAKVENGLLAWHITDPFARTNLFRGRNLLFTTHQVEAYGEACAKAAQPAAQEPVTAIDEAFYFAVADKRGMVAECFDFVDYCPEKGKVPEHWEMKYTVRTMLEVQEHRYRNALAAISLTERDTTTAAADKIREAARIARKALEGKP